MALPLPLAASNESIGVSAETCSVAFGSCTPLFILADVGPDVGLCCVVCLRRVRVCDVRKVMLVTLALQLESEVKMCFTQSELGGGECEGNAWVKA